MAAFKYVSLKCVNQWCGAKFTRPLIRHNSTRACTKCGRAAFVSLDRVNEPQRAGMIGKEPLNHVADGIRWPSASASARRSFRVMVAKW